LNWTSIILDPTFPKEVGVMRLSDETLRGRTVIASDGLAVGHVARLYLDSDAWQVESLQVVLRKEVADRIGVSRNMFRAGTLEMPVSAIQSVGDAVVLSVASDALRAWINTSTESEASSAH
jgi:sporulation protein YlmC with PRC-barrel domain